MGLFSRDTSARVERLQAEIHRALSPEQRHAIGVTMSDELRDIALAGVRKRHPELTQMAALRLYVTEVLGWKLPPVAGEPRR